MTIAGISDVTSVMSVLEWKLNWPPTTGDMHVSSKCGYCLFWWCLSLPWVPWGVWGCMKSAVALPHSAHTHREYCNWWSTKQPNKVSMWLTQSTAEDVLSLGKWLMALKWMIVMMRQVRWMMGWGMKRVLLLVKSVVMQSLAQCSPITLRKHMVTAIKPWCSSQFTWCHWVCRAARHCGGFTQSIPIVAGVQCDMQGCNYVTKSVHTIANYLSSKHKGTGQEKIKH